MKQYKVIIFDSTQVKGDLNWPKLSFKEEDLTEINHNLNSSLIEETDNNVYGVSVDEH